MQHSFLTLLVMAAVSTFTAQAKDLVAYFSAEGHTQAVAERIAELMGADIYRIQAAEPYAANPYDDSDRIQREAYNDLRPAAANLPAQEWIDGYDRIFVGSPCWWHQPAMVVCTFLENYDLSRHVIIPFFTYGATTYLNESMQKIYRCTPNSVHVPATLPEDLDPEDITRPGRPDDAGIDMPGNARGVEGWLERLGITGSGIGETARDAVENLRLYPVGGSMRLELDERMADNTVDIFDTYGRAILTMADRTSYTFTLPRRAVYLFSVTYGSGNRRANRKFMF